MSRRLALLLILATGLTARGPATPAHHDAPPTPSPAHEAPVAPAVVEEKAEGGPEAPSSNASAHAEPTAPAHVPPPATAAPPGGSPTTAEELSSLLRLGAAKSEKGDYEAAEFAFLTVLKERATRDQDRLAVLGIARLQRKRGDFTKAVAAYEKLLAEFPESTEQPEIYLELGRTYRALGAYKLATMRFYSVINATLKLPAQGADLYRQLARTAQFEIAETHFIAGEFDQASKYFSRLRLLDLAPEDRLRAQFKAAHSLVLAGDFERAARALRAFIDEQPTDENAPEARYLLAISLRRLGRSKEAFTVAVDLLRSEQGLGAKDPKRWAYWQRRTGNQIANEFYEQGEFQSALTIYQFLVDLAPDPIWRLPALYQAGLCRERLGQIPQARTAYQTVIDKPAGAPADDALQTAIGDVVQMASWRLKNLDWQADVDRQFTTLFATGTVPSATSPILPATADHDANGSAAKPPLSLR